MEEEIRNLINENVKVGLEGKYPFEVKLTYTDSAAKEIDKLTKEHYMEFVEWIGENCFKYDNDDKGWIIIGDKRDTELGTTEQAYTYWKEKIK